MNIDIVLETMNRAFAADPTAIHALVCNRIPCNAKLADDKDIIVWGNPVIDANIPTVGLLGIINGLLSACGSKELLTIQFDNDTHKCLGFGKTEKVIG